MEIATKRKGNLESLTVDKYFSLIEHAADGIAVIQDGVLKLANTALARISGYDKEELLGMPFTKLLTPESQKLAVARHQARLAGKKVPPIYEVQAITKDGEIREIELNAALTEYEGHLADEVIIRDITERKQAETLFKTLSDSLLIGVYIVQEGKFVFTNPQFQKAMGFTEAELLGMAALNTVHPEDRERVRTEVIKRLKGELSSPYEFRTITKTGETRVVMETITSIQYQGKRAGLGSHMDITERRKAEQALADEATRRRILVEQSRDGIVVLDQNGKVYEANKQFAEMLGYTPEEIAELHVWDWDTQWSREQLLEMLRSVDEAGDHFETYHRRKDSTTIDVEISTNGAICAGQKLVFCVCRGITERKKMEQQLQEKNEELDVQNEELKAINEELRAAEEELQEKNEELDVQNEELKAINEELRVTGEELQQSREELERMFESVTDGITVTDLDGNIIKVNQRVVEMHGFTSADELLGRSVLELTAPSDHEKITKNIQKAPELGATRGMEHTMRRVDGSEFPGEISANTLKDASGKPVGIITVGRDITERKQAGELFRTVANSSPIGIYIIQDRTFQLVNPQFQKLTGYAKDELLGMDSLTLVLDEDRDMVREKAIKMLQGERSFPYQFRVITKTGEIRWVMETVTSIQYRGRRAALGNYMDITERRQAEDRERQLQQELDLTSRLASIGQLAAGVAHEINNPLTGVIGFSHLMLNQDIPDDMKRDLQVINSEARRVAKIVENLLTFAHQRKPGREYININDIIARVLELRAYEMKVNNIEIETQLAPDLLPTMADAGQLQQVFLNIILNAEHFMTMAHNRGKLLVKTEKIDNSIRASFTDDGAGINKENLDKIFNPFFTTKEVGNGTGLGLSICHGIITQHKGRIYAQSELGQGATFVVELPIVEEPIPAERAETTKDEAEKPRGAKILVVDDEPAILNFLRRLLTGCGHSVETINSADAALDRLKTERYSLILLDIKLPGMSGIELYRHIEAIAPALTRRVMFITGDVMEPATRDFLERTKVPHITKPLDIELLKKTINNALNQIHVATTTSE